MKVCEMLSIGPAAKQSLVNSGMVVTVGDNCRVKSSPKIHYTHYQENKTLPRPS